MTGMNWKDMRHDPELVGGKAGAKPDPSLLNEGWVVKMDRGGHGAHEGLEVSINKGKGGKMAALGGGEAAKDPRGKTRRASGPRRGGGRRRGRGTGGRARDEGRAGRAARGKRAVRQTSGGTTWCI